jgi:hypothetical protein
MMRLSAAVRKDTGVYPGDGVVGRERETWYKVATLDVTSGAIDLADLGGFPGDSFPLPVARGAYVVEARLIDFDGSMCVSRVRVRPDGKVVKLGPKGGKIAVDFAALAIGDFGRIRKELSVEQQEELNEGSRRFMQIGFCEMCRVKVGGKTVQFVVCKAGFGDGSYTVYPLNHRGRAVGFEVEFIRDGYVLP